MPRYTVETSHRGLLSEFVDYEEAAVYARDCSKKLAHQGTAVNVWGVGLPGPLTRFLNGRMDAEWVCRRKADRLRNADRVEVVDEVVRLFCADLGLLGLVDDSLSHAARKLRDGGEALAAQVFELAAEHRAALAPEDEAASPESADEPATTPTTTSETKAGRIEVASWVVSCVDCGDSHVLRDGPAHDFLEAEARRAGWVKRRHRWVCPGCG